MRNILPALSLLLLAGCATHDGDDTPAATAALRGPVTYEVSSWGRLLTRWQVNPDGSGEFWRGAGVGKGLGEVSKFRMTLSGEGLRAFTAATEPLRQRTAKKIPCSDEITDQPYGSMTWDYPGARQSYAFDAGCRSPEADVVGQQIRALSEIVEKQAAIEAKPYIVETPADR